MVFGWPLFLGLAVRQVDAVHASVISGVTDVPWPCSGMSGVTVSVAPDTGCCVSGPCRGDYLAALRVEERDGCVYLLSDEDSHG